MQADPALKGIAALKVVDFGVGMAAALVAKQLVELGTQVMRIEPESGDPFYDHYPAYRVWRSGERIAPASDAPRLLDHADICIIGGEDYPGLAAARPLEEARQRNPRLIVLRLTGVADDLRAGRPAVELLVQARSGMAYEQFSDRPIAVQPPLASYGAALQGLIGTWVALLARMRDGEGQEVAVSLLGGAAMFWAPFWMEAERPDRGFLGITPRDVRHLTLPCADGRYVQITLGVPGACGKVDQVLGIRNQPAVAQDRGIPDASRGPERFFGDVESMSARSALQDSDTLLRAFQAAGIPAEKVLAPGEAWEDRQTAANGCLRTDDRGWRYVGSPVRIRSRGAADGTPHPLPLAEGVDLPPLAGVRVIDFGVFVAGPYASKLLADYGADVIRVEPPSGRATLSGERTIISANFGKRAICIDLKSADGRRLAEQIYQHADIVLHNFRPGVAERIGLNEAALRAINPNLIILQTSAYGSDGPKAPAPGFDMVMQAFCGIQHRAGGLGAPPLCNRAPVIDFAAGAVGAIGLLAALFERAVSGGGMFVEANLLSTGLHMMGELIQAPDGVFCGAEPNDRTRSGTHPAESLYRTADGWIAVAARGDAMARTFARIVGANLVRPRREWQQAEREELADRIAGFTTEDLLAALEAGGVWAEPCIADAWRCALPDGVILREMVDVTYGRVVHCLGPLVTLSRSTTPTHDRLSTGPGEDSAAILAQLGMAASTTEALFAAGTVR